MDHVHQVVMAPAHLDVMDAMVTVKALVNPVVMVGVVTVVMAPAHLDVTDAMVTVKALVNPVVMVLVKWAVMAVQEAVREHVSQVVTEQ